VTVVETWTCQDTRWLRDVLCMSVREFAAYRRVAGRAVAHSEERGARIQRRTEIRRTLDSAPTAADEATRASPVPALDAEASRERGGWAGEPPGPLAGPRARRDRYAGEARTDQGKTCDRGRGCVRRLRAWADRAANALRSRGAVRAHLGIGNLQGKAASAGDHVLLWSWARPWTNWPVR
jgi:hypothetical protein